MVNPPPIKSDPDPLADPHMSWTVTVAMSPTTISFSSSTSPPLDRQIFKGRSMTFRRQLLEATGNEFFWFKTWWKINNVLIWLAGPKFKTLIQCETPLEIDQADRAMRAYRGLLDAYGLILIYLDRSWYSVHFTGAKYSCSSMGFLMCFTRLWGTHRLDTTGKFLWPL